MCCWSSMTTILCTLSGLSSRRAHYILWFFINVQNFDSVIWLIYTQLNTTVHSTIHQSGCTIKTNPSQNLTHQSILANQFSLLGKHSLFTCQNQIKVFVAYRFTQMKNSLVNKKKHSSQLLLNDKQSLLKTFEWEAFICVEWISNKSSWHALVTTVKHKAFSFEWSQMQTILTESIATVLITYYTSPYLKKWTCTMLINWLKTKMFQNSHTPCHAGCEHTRLKRSCWTLWHY